MNGDKKSHLQDLDNQELVLGEDLGKAVGVLHQLIQVGVPLHEAHALRERETGWGVREGVRGGEERGKGEARGGGVSRGGG